MTRGGDPRDALRLPPGDGGGRTTAAVLAAMVFLALIAAAAGLGIANGIRLTGDRLDARLTVQVATGDAARILALSAAMPGVNRATPVDRADLVRLLRPWLGDDAAGLPIPAMIDLDLRDPTAAADVERRLRATGAVIRIDRAAALLAPTTGPLRRLMYLTTAIVAVLALATAAIVALAVRGAVAIHHEMIAVMHTLGATDRQIEWLFQRRIVVLAATGGAIGTVAALALTMVAGAGLRPVDWAMLATIPPIAVGLAMLATHLVVTRAARRMS